MNFGRPVGSYADLEPEERVAQREEVEPLLKRVIAEAERNTTSRKETNTMSEAGMQAAANPEKENIYLGQVGQLTNATDEILHHVDTIERKISIVLEPSPPTQAEDKESVPDVPPTSATKLSNSLAELASHLARLGQHVISLENKIIV